MQGIDIALYPHVGHEIAPGRYDRGEGEEMQLYPLAFEHEVVAIIPHQAEAESAFIEGAGGHGVDHGQFGADGGEHGFGGG